MHSPLRAAVAVADLANLDADNILNLANTAELAANRTLDVTPGMAPTAQV